MSMWSSLCFALVLVAAGLAAAPAGAITLSRDGKTEYVIVTSRNPTPPEKTAANLLAETLGKVTGARFAVRAEHEVASGAPQILVGVSRSARALARDVEWSGLQADEIVIRTTGDKLLLAGGLPRGTLYAVYTFLEDTVGCRWWTGTEELIPHRPTLAIGAQDIRYAPRFRSREAFYRFPNEDPLFASRLKLNGHFPQIPENYGGHMGFIGFVHTFYGWIPPGKYFAEHPEWFSLINGKRTTDWSQLCLTNPEMLKEMTRVVLENIEKNPACGIISVSQNDCHNPCQCDRCQALAKAEGSEAGPLIAFVNAVAEEVEKKHPDMLVETLAYQYTRKPPKTLKPSKNVVVRLCSIECDFGRPLESEANAAFRDDILGWKAIAPNLFIWNYVTDFAGYIQPHPNMASLAADLRFFANSNVIGVFEQGDCFTSVGDFVRMRNWVIAHLLWDPSRDQDALVREFASGYYGPAARHILAYLRLVQNAYDRWGRKLGCYNTDLSFLTLDDMNEAARLFAEAADAVRDDPTLSARVRRERMPLDHVWLLRYEELKQAAADSGKPFAGPGDPKAACEEFIALAKQWDARHATEGMPFETYIPSLRARFRPPAPSLDEISRLPDEDVISVEQDLFKLAGEGEWATIAQDAGAHDGKAARMPGGHTQWAVQLHITEEMAKRTTGQWAVYAIVRCDATASKGSAFDLGIYDTGAGREAVRKQVGVAQAKGAEYRVFDLGAHKLTKGMYFWAAPLGNGSDVQYVYIDRVILIREK